jgi:hypothetical protein
VCDRIDVAISTGTTCIFGTQVPGVGCAPLDDTTAASALSNLDDHTFSSGKLTAATALAPNASQTYDFAIRMKKTLQAEVPGCGTTGFQATTGQGCDNKYMNRKATLTLKWLLQDS